MKVAIASSGLAHVARGIETWALDTARALASQGTDTTLFCNTMPAPPPPTSVAQGSLRRNDSAAKWLAHLTPPMLWRRGFKSTYGWEQARFWHALFPKLTAGKFDILHVQDPMVAWWCARARHAGKLQTREILAHGTEEPPEFLAKFEYVQHLAPWHLEQASQALDRTPTFWCALPNFVDTTRFRPDIKTRKESRAAFELPDNAFVIGCAAALKRGHKRIDYLINEVAAAPEQIAGRPVHLLLCGASQQDTQDLLLLGIEKLGDRFHLRADVPHERMPEVLAAMDIFALASLFEMMPIAVLESLASGTPLLLNDHPVLRWMGGVDAPEELRGADCVAMKKPGALTKASASLDLNLLNTRGKGARQRAETMFSTTSVISRYLDYYTAILQPQ